MMTPDLNDLQLERLLLDELPAAERARVQALVDADPALRERVEALRSSDTQVLTRHPPEQVVPQIQRRLHVARTRDAVARAQRRRAGVLALLAPVAVAAVALVAVQPALLDGVTGPGVEETTPKGAGDARLRVFRKSAGGPEALAPGDRADDGDVLQVSFNAGDARHATVLSIDGAGAVTLHWPVRPDGDTTAKGKVLVPRSYTLDDAPRFERFVLVTSDQPIDVSRTLDAGRALVRAGAGRTGTLPLDDSLEQTTFLVEKGAR